MLKLRDVGSRNIHERRIRLNDTISDERSHTEMVSLYPQPLKVAPGENQSPEILLDGLQ